MSRLSRPCRAVGRRLLLLAALVLLSATPGWAQERPDAERSVVERFGDGPLQVVRAERFTVNPEDVCVLHPGEPVPPGQVRARSMLRQARPEYQQTATFTVDYEGFDGAEGQQAREAFQRAVDIWAEHVESPVPIKIQASFSDTLGERTLGSAASVSLWFLGPEGVDCTDPSENEDCTIYGDALADAVLGENVVTLDSDPSNDDNPDIVAFFSSEAPWYYGTAEPGPNMFDFTSVVLHELGHGLGFFGSMSVGNADDDAAEEGFWPFDPDNTDLPPIIYDRFAEDEEGEALTDESVYPNPSESLADVLTGGEVFFDSPSAAISTDGERPELYAPDTWQQGSSYSHVDEDTYPAGSEDALMSPRIGAREVFQRPGAIMCGMFQDMGWPMGPGCLELLNQDLIVFATERAADQPSIEIRWVLAAGTEVDAVEVQQRSLTTSGMFETIETVPAMENAQCLRGEEGRLACTVELEDLPPGSYTHRLVLVKNGERQVVELEESEFIEPDVFALLGVYPNPSTDRAQLVIIVEESQQVVVEVYNVLGQRVGVAFNGTLEEGRRVQVDSAELPSGVYFLRVRGEDFAATRKFVVAR